MQNNVSQINEMRKTSIVELRQILLSKAELEFSRNNVDYFIAYVFGYLKVWRCSYPARLVYEIELTDDDSQSQNKMVATVINAPVFDDGKSLVSAIDEIYVDWAG